MNDETYAVDVQQQLARIDVAAMTAAGVKVVAHTHDDLTSFVRSKCSVDESDRSVHVHELVTERDGEGRPRQVRVKVKSGEALVEHFATGDQEPWAARRDVTGADVIAEWLRRAAEASSARGAAERAAAAVVEQDSLAAAGQDWVPPHVTAWRDREGVVHLQSRSMFIPSNHPLPAGFTPPPGVLGVHYVTLPTPELLAEVVAATAELPRAESDPAPSYGRR